MRNGRKERRRGLDLRSGASHLSEESGSLARLGSGGSLLGRRTLCRGSSSGGRVAGRRRSWGSGPGRGSRRTARSSSTALTSHFR
jgi:hypothetical protein